MAYTTGDILVRSVMTAYSGLPADAVVNDFAFQKGSAATTPDLVNAMNLVADFFENVQATTLAVGEYISDAIDRGATHELQAWVITAPPLGSPDATQAWIGPPTAASPSGEPTEIAGVLSFHADLTGILEESGATRPRARRRGRVYIGPLNDAAIDNTTPPYLLSDGFLTTLRQAAVELFDNAVVNGIPWSVWSRTDATLRPIVAGWTDNAPDTQRRRGVASSARVAWIP